MRDPALEVLAGLVFACAARGAYSITHIVRPAIVSKCLAALLGCSRDEQEQIRLATAAHDVGKLAVPDALLSKPSALSDDERLKMRSHSAVGASLFGGIRHPLLQVAATIAHYHHERYDGTGYPEHLNGAQIPMPARIVAVADVFDALTESRHYHAAMSDDQAAELIAQGAGTQFDPLVAEAFLGNFEAIISERNAADALIAQRSHQDILNDFFRFRLLAGGNEQGRTGT